MKHRFLTKRLTFILTFIFALQIASGLYGQQPSREDLPSVADEPKETYLSKDGYFSVRLPMPKGPLIWTFREGEIRMGFFDYYWNIKQIPLQYFERIAEDFDKETLAKVPGTIIGQVQTATIDPYASTTYYAFNDGRFGIQKHYMVKKRFYTLLAVAQSFLDRSVFERVLDTFSVTGEVDNDALMKRRIQERTLSALPQSPVSKGERTDLAEENMKGPVAMLVEEVQDLHDYPPDDNQRGIKGISEFDKRGYLLRKVTTGIYGNPDEVEIWGFIDRKRVSKLGFSLDRYRLFDPIVGTLPAEGPNKLDPSLGYDPRYYLSYKKNYRSGKLSESIIFNNSGKVNLRRTYEYKGSRVIVSAYGPQGEFRYKTSSRIDRNGNFIDEVLYSSDPRDLPARSTFEYLLDQHGNWIRKTVFLEIKYGNRTEIKPQYAIYRTISYF